MARKWKLQILANTRSPEAQAAADIHLHVLPRPASASVCTAGRWARPHIRVSRGVDPYETGGHVPRNIYEGTSKAMSPNI